MPGLEKLNIRQLRNLEGLALEPAAGVNILYGKNGSGKTSILEAIYLLGLARSFRSSQLKSLVQHEQDQFTLFARLSGGMTLGFQRGRKGGSDIRVAGKEAASVAELAQQLPLQLFNSDTFRVLEGSPKNRRNFIDWGVFHVEHQFFPVWRQLQKCLQQRNALLKQEARPEEVRPWTYEFVRCSELIDKFRQSYLDSLLPHVDEVLGRLYPIGGITFHYERGWEAEQELDEILERHADRDRRYGHTHYGPHRAELRIGLDGMDAVEVLSRGQQKLLVCALKLAQGILLQSAREKACVYLIDDLPSELDDNNRAALCRVLETLGSQAFITCVERQALDGCWERSEEKRLFHVKHGKITG